jgi:hypothetical protein
MADLTGNITCASCRERYGVELRKMRLNFTSICPRCGVANGVTEKQAIEAQRLLERLEMGETLMKVA